MAVNVEVNGWCPTCKEWSVRGRHEQCMWCDTPLRDAELKRPGTGPRKISEELLREAHELYMLGYDENGRPLSVRKVAALIMPRTGYSSLRSCANSLHEAWRARGWPLRDRVDATRAAHITHGELVGTKQWKTSEARARKNAYKRKRRRRRRCSGTTVKGKPCAQWAQNGKDVCEVHDPERRFEVVAKLAEARARGRRQKQATTTEGAANVSRDHRQGHDDERPREAVAWPWSGARNEAA